MFDKFNYFESVKDSVEFQDLWAKVLPAATEAFQAYVDDGKIDHGEAVGIILTLYPKAFDWVDNLPLPNLGESGDVSKHNIVCAAMDKVFDAILDPDIAWVPNWIEDPVEDAIKFGLHVMTHVLHARRAA